jgi:hypothetical protein
MEIPSIPKDAMSLVSPDSVIRNITRLLGRGWQVALLSDLVKDTLPSHIIGAKAFLAKKADINSPIVVKVGLYKDLAQEVGFLKQLADRDRHLKGIATPVPIELIDLQFENLSAALITFNGLHTLESFRLSSPNLIPSYLYNIMRSLASEGIIWPNVMPRNVVVGLPRTKPYLCLVDWERGWLEPRQISEGPGFYLRCIELHEELSTFSHNTFAYWSEDWPRIEDLANSSHQLAASVNIGAHSDPRIRMFGEYISLPHIIGDSQFLRLIHVFANSCERSASLFSPLYAADQLSAWEGGLPTRLKAILLSWYLDQTGMQARRAEILDAVIRAGLQVHFLWRSQMSDLNARVFECISALDDGLNSVGETILSGIWEEAISDTCRNFVLNGKIDHSFEVLFELGRRP